MGKSAHKPTALRALEGGRSNSLPKPEDVNEVNPQPECPKPPRELSTRAKKIWNRLAPKLFRLNLLTEVDEDALFVLCNDIATIREAVETGESLRKELKKTEDQLVLSDKEKERISLIMKQFANSQTIYRRVSQNYMKHAKEFGLTPRGRVGLVVGGTGNGGAGADLLT